MTRPKRINIPFSLFHVISRTNSGDKAFLDARDFRKFFEYLVKYISIFNFSVHAFCIMDNHFHLLMESREIAGLSELMRRLLTAYTVYFNKKRQRHGHLFQGRFKSFVVDKGSYLLELSRYIHLNPARSTPSHNPRNYSWSSFHYYIRGSEPPWLHVQETLSWFKGKRDRYEQFVMDGLNEEKSEQGTILEIYQQRIIGGKNFARRIYSRLKMGKLKKTAGNSNSHEMNKAEKLVYNIGKKFNINPEKLKAGRYPKGNFAKARRALVQQLRETLPWSWGQIADFLNLKNPFSAYKLYIRVNSENDITNITKKKVRKTKL